MSTEFDRCVKERKLVKIKEDRALINKELKGAEYDLSKAKKSLEDDDFKWATIKAYYSMFHSARALVFSKGYREKTHYCLMIALEKLFVDSGILDRDSYENFERVMDLREEADYGLSFSETGADIAVRDAENFLMKIKQILDRRGGMRRVRM